MSKPIVSTRQSAVSANHLTHLQQASSFCGTASPGKRRRIGHPAFEHAPSAVKPSLKAASEGRKIGHCGVCRCRSSSSVPGGRLATFSVENLAGSPPELARFS
jgi:hypothetical protein